VYVRAEFGGFGSWSMDLAEAMKVNRTVAKELEALAGASQNLCLLRAWTINS